MARPDEVARRRARSVGHPSTFERDTVRPSPVAVPDLAELKRNKAEASHALVVACREARAVRRIGGRDFDEIRAALATERVKVALDRMEAASLALEAGTAVLRAHRDGLTGCLSRDSGLEQLRQELDRAGRQQTDLVVVFLDVDGLKQVNDTRGHLAGDGLLRAVGAALKECLRSYDVVLRFGGDEFVCGLPGLQTTEARVRMADVARELDRRWPGARFTAGFALAFCADDVDAVVERADADLYRQRRERAAVVRIDRAQPTDA
ncbi:MAG: diguanylate cyclase domain-containing protein [Actinomycetes bacterium]